MKLVLELIRLFPIVLALFLFAQHGYLFMLSGKDVHMFISILWGIFFLKWIFDDIKLMM